MAEIPRTGTTWDLVARDLVAGRAPVDGSTAGAVVTYTATIQSTGTVYSSGAMTWEGDGYEDAWVARFNLPASPCVLVCVVTASVPLTSGSVIGKKQASLNVVG